MAPINVYVGQSDIPGSSWPDATNTGVPAGVSLTTNSSGLDITAADTVVDAVHFTGGNVLIEAGATNVTIKRCKFSSDAWGFLQQDVGAPGLLIQDCEFDGLGANSAPIWLHAKATVLRCNIHSMENGIVVFSSTTGGTLIEDCYIHDNVEQVPEPSPHPDLIETWNGLNGLTVNHCHLLLNNAGTSCINLYNELDSTISNITITNNLLRGLGGFAVYFPKDGATGWSNIVCDDNVWEPNGSGGYHHDANWTEFLRNVDYITGDPVT